MHDAPARAIASLGADGQAHVDATSTTGLDRPSASATSDSEASFAASESVGSAGAAPTRRRGYACSARFCFINAVAPEAPLLSGSH